MTDNKWRLWNKSEESYDERKGIGTCKVIRTGKGELANWRDWFGKRLTAKRWDKFEVRGKDNSQRCERRRSQDYHVKAPHKEGLEIERACYCVITTFLICCTIKRRTLCHLSRTLSWQSCSTGRGAAHLFRGLSRQQTICADISAAPSICCTHLRRCVTLTCPMCSVI